MHRIHKNPRKPFFIREENPTTFHYNICPREDTREERRIALQLQK
jgi:hypothetical protein